MTAEVREGIPVHAYFDHMKLWPMISFHLFNTMGSLVWAIYGFSTVPNLLLCDSMDVCSCKEGAFPVLDLACNATTLDNSTSSVAVTDDDECDTSISSLLGLTTCGKDSDSSLDVVLVIVSFVAMIALVAVFAAASAWMRQRETAKVAQDAQTGAAAMKYKLNQAVAENENLTKALKEAQQVVSQVMSEASLRCAAHSLLFAKTSDIAERCRYTGGYCA